MKVTDLHPARPKHLVQDPDAFGAIGAARVRRLTLLALDTATLVLFSAQQTANTAHGPVPPGAQAVPRGNRTAKSEAISSIVTKRTPGWDFM
jgi:hypothetical protein